MAVVIIGLIFSSFFAAVGTTAALSASHRNLVSADTVLRDSAEAVKAAVRANCPTSTSFTTTTLATEPAASSSTNQCPVDATHVRQVDLSYTTLGGANEKLSIEIRTP